MISNRLPEYVKDTRDGNKKRKEIILSLGFSEGHGRLEWLFSKICDYIVFNKSSTVVYDNFVGWLIESGELLIKGESNIRIVLDEVLKILSENDFCNIKYLNLKEPSDKIVQFTFLNPIVKTVLNFMDMFYAKNEMYDYKKSLFIRSLSFINVSYIAKQNSLDQEDILNILEKRSLKEVFSDNTTGSRKDIIEIVFSSDEGKPFYLLMTNQNNFRLFLENTIFSFVRRVIAFNTVLAEKFNREAGHNIDGVFFKFSNMSQWGEISQEILDDVLNSSEDVFDEKFRRNFNISNDEVLYDFLRKILVILKDVIQLELSIIEENKMLDEINENIIEVIKLNYINKFYGTGLFLSKIDLILDLDLGNKKVMHLYEKDALVKKLEEDITFVYLTKIDCFFYKDFFIEVIFNEINKEKDRLKVFFKKKYKNLKNNLKTRKIRKIIDEQISNEINFLLYYSKQYLVENKDSLLSDFFLDKSEAHGFKIDLYPFDEEERKNRVEYLKNTLFYKGKFNSPILNSKILFKDDELKNLVFGDFSDKKSNFFSTEEDTTFNFLDLILLPFQLLVGYGFLWGRKKEEKSSMEEHRKNSVETTRRLVTPSDRYNEIRKNYKELPSNIESFNKKLDELERKWNTVFLPPEKIVHDWDKLSLLERRKKQHLIDEEKDEVRKNEREKVMKAVQKQYGNIDVLDLVKGDIRQMAENLTNSISMRINNKYLLEYIELLIIKMYL